MGTIGYRIKGKIASKEQWDKYVEENTIDMSASKAVKAATTKVKELSVTLPNGLELKGPKEVVEATAKSLGHSLDTVFPEKDFYNSESKGYIRYQDMDSNHLMNVAAKRMTPWLKDLIKDSKVGADFVNGLTGFHGIEKHTTLLATIKELSTRRV